MLRDFASFLWLLKLGALVNVVLLADALALRSGDAHVVVPALVFFAVSAYRCLFPVYYTDDVVFHDSPLSSIFVTRLLATFSEVAYIYQFSYVIRWLNVDGIGGVDALAWLMVVEVVLSQGFVWGAILSGRAVLYFWEELGWLVLFLANTVASGVLLATLESPGRGELLLQLNLVFGVVYLPWQTNHLRVLLADARARRGAGGAPPPVTRALLADGLRRCARERNATSEPGAWGGLVGLTWMAAYWATLVPLWVHVVVEVAGPR